jgi:hypothetical protein
MTEEELIPIAIETNLPTTWINKIPTLHWPDLKRFADLVAAHEREECAKVADKWAVGWPHPSTVIAEEIRARKNT